MGVVSKWRSHRVRKVMRVVADEIEDLKDIDPRGMRLPKREDLTLSMRTHVLALPVLNAKIWAHVGVVVPSKSSISLAH